MKLLNKITLWFIGIILLVTPVSMYISYTNIRKTIDQADAKRLAGVNDCIARQLKEGITPNRSAQGRPISILPIAGPLPGKKSEITETATYNEELKQRECKLTVHSFYEINGQHYRISSHDYIIKAEDILGGMMRALAWKMALIILALLLTARLLSRYIFFPFRQTMRAIHRFDLRRKEKMQFAPTTTREFRELNAFLKKMTDKAMEDYASIREFSENASHELQTPLAVIRSKLELLMETGISESQAALISDTLHAIEKLSRINRSLTVLTRLENQEFDHSGEIRFCRVTKDVLAIYADRIQLKEIEVISSLDRNIMLHMHPSLAEMLLNNLLGNAIRHNVKGGTIRITLTANELCISNTGLPPEIPTEELFGRFKKSNQCADSIGLGLAIVKQICTVCDFSVSYEYLEGWHTLTVRFGPGFLSTQHERLEQPAWAPVSAVG